MVGRVGQGVHWTAEIAGGRAGSFTWKMLTHVLEELAAAEGDSMECWLAGATAQWKCI